MGGDRMQAIMKVLRIRHRFGMHLVEYPQGAMASNGFLMRKLAQGAIAGKQHAGLGLSKGEGEAVWKRQCGSSAPEIQSRSDRMPIKLLNAQAQCKQLSAVILFYLLFIEKIRYSKFVRQTEGGLQQ